MQVLHPTWGCTLGWDPSPLINPSSTEHKPMGSWGLEEGKEQAHLLGWRKGGEGKGDFSS